jgi:CO/xanthine dehydrogenase FAD-binding subunit
MLSEAEYHRPTTVESACELLDEIPEAIVVAGGQSLSLLTKEGIITPEVLVDINDIDELEEIKRINSELRFGATTTHRTIEQSELVGEEIPVLQKAASHIADMQIRNAGTIGGVTAYADPTAEYPLVFLALDAEIDARTINGTETYQAREFFKGYYQSALDTDELVTEVRLPVLGDNEGAGYEKLAYRENDRAVVNVVSSVKIEDGICTDVSIAVGSVTDRPVLAKNATGELIRSELTDVDIEAAAETAKEEVPVDPDPSISVEYREDMVQNLVENTLEDARKNAGGN